MRDPGKRTAGKGGRGGGERKTQFVVVVVVESTDNLLISCKAYLSGRAGTDWLAHGCVSQCGLCV